jgi:hypothetical protein
MASRAGRRYGGLLATDEPGLMGAAGPSDAGVVWARQDTCEQNWLAQRPCHSGCVYCSCLLQACIVVLQCSCRTLAIVLHRS